MEMQATSRFVDFSLHFIVVCKTVKQELEIWPQFFLFSFISTNWHIEIIDGVVESVKKKPTPVV